MGRRASTAAPPAALLCRVPSPLPAQFAPQPAARTEVCAAEELAWLADYAEGRQHGARCLVERYLPRLHRLAWRLLDDVAEAEDVCQEAFMKLWQQAPRWQARASIGTWLHQVALNAARDRLRKRRLGFDQSTELDELPDSRVDAGPEQLASERQARDWLSAAIADLPPRQREAVLLCHDQQFSQREAAAIMQIEIGALESLLSRARQQLRLAAEKREVSP